MSDITKIYIKGKMDEVQKVREVLRNLNLKSIEVYDDYDKSEIINAETVANDLAKYYGKYVRYKAPNGCDVKWRIFGSDKRNIHLIADAYILKDYIPSGKKGSQITFADYNDYQVLFDDIVEDYNGSEDINKKMRMLNRKYFDALKGKHSNRFSIKAVAYMLDVDAWMASSCGYCYHELCYIYYYGADLNSGLVGGYGCGLRPLVFLKSDIVLKLVKEDEYEIQ